jgi:Protein of unknown function DUF262/Protein of unknown function (DUF1524)
MAVSNFNTSNQTLRKLMGNGLVHRVPTFQRDYSWTEQEWDDLWQDIVALQEPDGEAGHYMGYLVLQSQDDRTFDIIDGQQRITTLSILVLAILNNLGRLVQGGTEPEDNSRRIEELRRTYVGFVDPATLVATPKLTLNRHNNVFYQNYLVPLALPLPRRNLKASEQALRRAFEWFDARVQHRFVGRANGADLARLVDTLADRLFFTVISVTDELNAFKVFETLNARGVRLSSSDLLKNHLFSVVHRSGAHDQEIATLESLWESMVGKLASESLPDFLRTHWNSRRALTRHTELFKTIRTSVRDPADVFGLLRALDRDADVYAALGDPHDPQWTPEQGRHIAALATFGVRQPYPLLLAARRTLDDVDFTRVLRGCVVVSLRYNVIGGRTPTEQERVYNAVAMRASAADAASAKSIIEELRPIYVADAEFRAAFADKQLRTTTTRNRKVARYLLLELEKQVSGKPFDATSDKLGIEHVLPQNPGDGWEMFTDEQVERATYRLGNMTLLATAANRDVGAEPFASKRSVYAASMFELTRRISAEHDEWTEDAIASRQAWLATQATSAWRLSELD